MSTQPSIGSLFSGYGGLDLAVERVLNARTVWQCEWEDAPSAVLARHWPDVPNHRDVTAVDWAELPPVDIITGGFPCQDVSLAGRRAGMTEGTRSNLWGAMRSAVEIIRPAYVVAENVRGLLSAKAESASDMEPRPGLLGDGGDGHLRALGRVLGDLADLGYNTQWCGLRASDVGAPHHRYRVFILATRRDVADTLRGGGDGRAEGPEQARRDHAPVGSGAGGVPGGEPAGAADAGSEAGSQRPGLRTGEQERERRARPDHGGSHAPHAAGGGRDRGPDRQGDRRDPGVRGETRNQSAHRGGTPATPHAYRDESERDGGLGRLAGPPRTGEGREEERQRLWDATGDRGQGTDGIAWGNYEPAVRRWEPIVGRRAPAPTEPNTKGGHRLSPRFAEWMMGLPAGWVTDTPGITRALQLKALGNGVVPQQAEAALNHMLNRQETP